METIDYLCTLCEVTVDLKGIVKNSRVKMEKKIYNQKIKIISLISLVKIHLFRNRLALWIIQNSIGT